LSWAETYRKVDNGQEGATWKPCGRSPRSPKPSEENDQFPAQLAVVERMIHDQQRYLDNPVSLAVHCMSLFADYLPFEKLAVLVLSDKPLFDDTIAVLELDQEFDDAEREFQWLQFFKLRKEDAEYLIEVPLEEEDWERGMPEDMFQPLARSCSWELLGPERRLNEDLPTYRVAGAESGDAIDERACENA
jgi:hypothetical protein